MNNRLKNLIDILFAALSAFSLTMSMSVSTDLLAQPDIISEIFSNINNSFSDDWITTFLLFRIILFMRKRFADHAGRKYKWGKAINLFIALIWLMAEGFRRNNSLSLLFCTYGQMLKSIIYFIGSYQLLNVLMYAFSFLIENHGEHTADNPNRRSSVSVFFKYFILLIVLWIPHLLSAYPAFICYDSYYQLAQYFGIDGWTSHHPPLNTLLMGKIIEIGKYLKDGNFGFFLYIAFQAVLFAAILSYGIVLLKKLKTPKWLLVLLVICAVAVPYYSAYIGVIVKDNIYSYAFVLFFIEIIYLAIRKEEYFDSVPHLLLWCLSVTALLLMRNNGKYVIIPFYLIMIIYAFRHRTVFSGKTRLLRRLVLILAVPLILNWGLTFCVTKKYDIQPGSIREALSLPLQQTARFVKAHQNEVTESEEIKLRSVMDYDRLAEAYDPRISDPVKVLFVADPSFSQLKDYLLVWGQQFIRHPATYVNATVNQNYYLVYPKVANILVYAYTPENQTGFPKQNEVNKILGAYDIDSLKIWKQRFNVLYKASFNLPVLYLLSHPAFYVILFIWLLCFAAANRFYSWLMISIPNILNILIILLAPAIQGQPRYAFPLIYSFSFALCYYIYIYNSKKAERFDNITDKLPQGDYEM